MVRPHTDDNVLVTVAQIVDIYDLTMPRVRTWVAAGLLKPIRREGRGRSGQMLFAKGEVVKLVYGICPLCGDRFKRKTLKQFHCSRLCRNREARARGRGKYD